jgi:hypothetical protein
MPSDFSFASLSVERGADYRAAQCFADLHRGCPRPTKRRYRQRFAFFSLPGRGIVHTR